MRRFTVAVMLSLAGAIWGSGAVSADTRAPSTQTFVIECGGMTVTVVSPVFSARAAQVVGTTGVAILQQVVLYDDFGVTVLFEQPSVRALRASALTTCTLATPEGTLVLTVLMTPQGRNNS
jgi:hypothetical protein